MPWLSWTLALLIGSITAAFALAGGYFSHFFTGFSLKLIFALMLFAAVFMVVNAFN